VERRQPTGKVAGSREPAAEAGKGPATTEQASPRVLIVDPDPLARRVIRDALQGKHRFVVPATAGDGVEAVELARYYRPELALLEIALPRVDGIAATRQIVESVPEVMVVIFSAHDSEETQLAALRAGASGFISKSRGVDQLAQACAGVVRGEAAVSRTTTMRLIERLRVLPEGGIGMRPIRSPLTPREWQVLDMITQDLDTRAIAERLVVSEDTVYSHVKHLFRKLGVHSRAEAVQMAREMREPIAVRRTGGTETNVANDGANGESAYGPAIAG
jgi:two-component system, NarL family, response regulator LiaR